MTAATHEPAPTIHSDAARGAHGILGSVWDLDHTLVSTDTFAEQLATTVLRRPWLVPHVMLWLFRGRGYCKGRIAAIAATPPENWPVKPEALERIAADRNRGRTIVLATAAHRDVAGPIAERLGCFDAVLATDDQHNLKSQHKSAAIARLAGVQGWTGYSYAGDCEADLAVWRDADEIVVVDPTPGLLSRLKRLGKPLAVLGATRTAWPALVRACRPHQWAKNILLFVPMLLAHQLNPATFCSVSIGFVAFSLCASSVYVLNDIGDVAADRQHPRKQFRPFASGRLSITSGLRLAAALCAGGLGLAGALLAPHVLGLLVLYLIANLVYSGRLKQVPVLDVLMLACMYALRLETGAVAAHVPLSDWLLTFSLFFFTSLAFAKRYTELLRVQTTGGGTAAGRGYEVGDVQLLETLGSSAGYVSVLVLALYMNSDQMRSLYGESRLLWLACPIVLYWVTRLWLLANRGQLDEDPVVFTLRDRTSLGLAALCGLIVLYAGLWGTPKP